MRRSEEKGREERGSGATSREEKRREGKRREEMRMEEKVREEKGSDEEGWEVGEFDTVANQIGKAITILPKIKGESEIITFKTSILFVRSY